MLKRTKNFSLEIFSFVRINHIIVCLEVYDKRKKKVIYHEERWPDYSEALAAFRDMLPPDMLNDENLSIGAILRETPEKTKMWVECSVKDLKTGKTIISDKIACSFAKTYVKFEGQPDSEWEKEVFP